MPNAFACAHDAGRDEVPLVLGHVCQKVEGDREVEIAWIKINDVIRPPGGNAIQNVLSQIAVRINETNAMAQGNVLNEEVP